VKMSKMSTMATASITSSVSRVNAAYADIKPAGGDTATPLNLSKRLRAIEQYVAIDGKQILDCGCGAGEVFICRKLAENTLLTAASVLFVFRRRHVLCLWQCA